MEDQSGLLTLNTIKRLFGDRVENIVRQCSDSESPDPHHKLPWHQRKRAYLERLGAASPDALLVSAADKLHNARDILACYRQMGDEVWRRFNADATKADHLGYYRDLVTRFRARPEVPNLLVEELDRVVTTRESLASVQSST